ncbi:MAG: hypothetical protein LC102_06090 [Ignavibacteriales bacterium]|nr:hypothetical protein [Ignavibacteria bacterium]MBZ0198189.1 hypothetical protein [Ignavibacteriaceae bacterium]MCZ2142979.1 hypothetical protein [Ignavibacteriales bacterium]WKZ71881.1 MAG: hypothetical protein QY308_09645 [Ignavibacteriaceae bacterium]
MRFTINTKHHSANDSYFSKISLTLSVFGELSTQSTTLQMTVTSQK